jgi:hypothetical protein
MEKAKRINPTWVYIKDDFNRLKDGETISYSSWLDSHKQRYLTALVKLGYIERAMVYYKTREAGAYRKIKPIPNELQWEDAQKEASTLNVNLRKKVRKYTLWHHTIEKINNHQGETFNANDLFPYKDYSGGADLYISKLYHLGYIERLDKKRNYKILGKIPENLTASLASKYLYDVIYKRQRKIQKIKEKLDDDTREHQSED